MPILKILLCMNMLLFVTCSATDSYSFKNKLRGLAAYEKANVERSYVFNANVDLTIDGEIFYHFDSIQSDTVAFYRNLDGSEFYALGIEEGIEESEGVEGKDAEVYRSTPASSLGAVNVGVLEPFLVLVDPI